MYGLSSALIGVVCFVTCKLHAIFPGNSFTKSRIFFWNVKHIWSHYNFKKPKQMCTTTDAEPRLPCSTRLCSCSLLTEILFAAEQARALRVLRLFGFNWNLNMLTSILRTLREFILFPFSQAWAIKQQFHWPQFCLFNCYCSFVHPCSCKANRWKPSPSNVLSFHRCRWWGFHGPSWVPSTHFSPPLVTQEPTCASPDSLQSRVHGDFSVHPLPNASPPDLPLSHHAPGSLNTSGCNCPGEMCWLILIWRSD